MTMTASRIRAQAEQERKQAAAQGMSDVDALAQQVGFLNGAIEGLALQLAQYTGAGQRPQSGCTLLDIGHGDATYKVEVEYEPLIPGRYSGPPEDCYPDEGGTLTIIQILINGQWIDPADLIADSVIEDWTARLYAQMAEAASEKADVDADHWRDSRIDDELTMGGV